MEAESLCFQRFPFASKKQGLLSKIAPDEQHTITLLSGSFRSIVPFSFKQSSDAVHIFVIRTSRQPCLNWQMLVRVVILCNRLTYKLAYNVEDSEYCYKSKQTMFPKERTSLPKETVRRREDNLKRSQSVHALQSNAAEGFQGVLAYLKERWLPIEVDSLLHPRTEVEILSVRVSRWEQLFNWMNELLYMGIKGLWRPISNAWETHLTFQEKAKRLFLLKAS